MNRVISNKLIIITILLLVILTITLLIFLPKKEMSENENRYLASLPKLTSEYFFSGDYMRDIEIYINDHFPYRDFIVGVKSQAEKIIGKTDQKGVYLGKDEYLIQYYDGYDNDTMDKHCKVIDDFSKTSDAQTYFMLVPTSNSIYPEKKPAFAYDKDQTESIKNFYSKLNYTVEVMVHNALKAEAKKQALYFRLDHHWNIHGAYIGYAQFCKAAKLDAIPKESFDIKEISDSFNGTYYSFSKYYSYTPDSIEALLPTFETDLMIEYVSSNQITDSLYNEKHLDTKDKFAYFLDGNHPQIIIKNNLISDNSSIAVIKDSYANNLVPFLTNHYQNVYVIDMRFFSDKLSEYVENNNIENVLFLYNIHTIRTDMGISKIY
jgi:hypothetical protein